ncbi:MAG: peptide ABC transporter substrate-binding protein [Anaerolineae bacterium]|nr:MAG: peptide ABC transporter substrate-binding protein [Anaerolineae bacterium]
MTFRNKRAGFLALTLLAGLCLSACARLPFQVAEKQVTRVVKETVVVEKERQVTRVVKEIVVKEATAEVTASPRPEPITFDGYRTADIATLDPQRARLDLQGDRGDSITYIENLFVQLTNYDPETAGVLPEAAIKWAVSDDGLTYTFNLRADIPWVYHNPLTGETSPDVDEAGQPRFVTAGNFVFGIQRACDPNVASPHEAVVAPLIVGCAEALNYGGRENLPPELVDAIGVRAPADDTLVVELTAPAGHFLTMTPMWTLSAVPQWAVARHGGEWIEPGNIVTSGRYVLHEWLHGLRHTLWRNPLLPADMQGSGNIERLVVEVVPDPSAGHALWLDNKVEVAAIPSTELAAHLEQFPTETDQIPDLAVFYISFRVDKPPFDDARVRRAFSAAFDRETFVAQVRPGWPMKHFAPPGIFGAPPLDRVGVGYDPDYARRQLAEANYPDCEDFPQVTLLGSDGQSARQWIEYARAQWQEHLGCRADLIQIEQRPFEELLAVTAIEAPVEEAPHMWTMGWAPKYADENNWVGDALWCESLDNRSRRTCNEIDALIVEARQESDPQRRARLYGRIEDLFFGYRGEMPLLPIWVRTSFIARHSWLERTPALFGGQQWYNWTLDWTAKQVARGQGPGPQ